MWKCVRSWWECVLVYIQYCSSSDSDCVLLCILRPVSISKHLMSHWLRPTAIRCSRAAHLILAQAASTDPSVHTMCSRGQPDRVATAQPAGILNHPGSGGLSEKNLSFGSWISCFSLSLSLSLSLFSLSSLLSLSLSLLSLSLSLSPHTHVLHLPD